MDSVARPHGLLQPQSIPPDPAHKVDVGVNFMIELSPHRQDVDPTRYDPAKRRLFGQFGIDVKPLRIICLRKRQHFGQFDMLVAGFSPLAQDEVLECPVR